MHGPYFLRNTIHKSIVQIIIEILQRKNIQLYFFKRNITSNLLINYKFFENFLQAPIILVRIYSDNYCKLYKEITCNYTFKRNTTPTLLIDYKFFENFLQAPIILVRIYLDYILIWIYIS
jgi:hypothetical protein